MNDKRSLQNDELIDDERPEVRSKSAKKREMLALQALGQELANLSEKRFQKIQFPEDALREALEFYRGIPEKKHEARRRQMQFIGKVMRGIEPNSLQAQLDAMKTTDNEEKRRHHQAEQWRDRLLDDPKQATDFLNEFATDVQRLNQLIRAAKKARELNKDKGEARSLYSALYAAIAH
ncbi:MAG: ribosome biogenesis factor YjgA [Pseudomonadota bacterium]|nr:ribosome biogenesis factor YjgA [Pseudomonadota bacterium]MEC8694433.1 ribosome biogenesis factor YjgA [Pseudomonadota bacterium]